MRAPEQVHVPEESVDEGFDPGDFSGPLEWYWHFSQRSDFPKGKPRNVVRIDDLTDDFPPVDKARGNITAAFGDVWANVKKNAEPNPLAS